LPDSPRPMRPMRKNFSRRFFKSASTDFTFFGGTTRIIPTPILKDCSNSPLSIFPSLARYLKIAGTGQDARSISAFTPLGSTRGRFPGMPLPVMCARAETQPRATMFFSAGRVAQMRLQQLRADFISDFGDVGIRLQSSNFKDQFARERIAVGMQAGGRQRDQSVSGLDTLAGEKILAFDGADDEACQIVFAGWIKSGHLRGFAADEGAAGFAARAAHAFDELLDDLRIELAHGQVVEEKQRLRALHENIVDAVIDEVAANSGVDTPWPRRL